MPLHERLWNFVRFSRSKKFNYQIVGFIKNVCISGDIFFFLGWKSWVRVPMSQVHFCHQYFLISMYLNLKVCHSTNKSYLNRNGNSHAAWAHENMAQPQEKYYTSQLIVLFIRFYLRTLILGPWLTRIALKLQHLRTFYKQGQPLKTQDSH